MMMTTEEIEDELKDIALKYLYMRYTTEDNVVKVLSDAPYGSTFHIAFVQCIKIFMKRKFDQIESLAVCREYIPYRMDRIKLGYRTSGLFLVHIAYNYHALVLYGSIILAGGYILNDLLRK